MNNFKYYWLCPAGYYIEFIYGKPNNCFEIDHELILLVENKRIKYE